MATDFDEDDERLADAKTAFPLTGNAASAVNQGDSHRDDNGESRANETEGSEHDDEHSE